MSDNTDELSKKLDAALASIEKLEAKNKELQTEKQKAKADADAAQEAAEEAAEEKARSAKDLEALEKSITKRFEKQIADLTRSNTEKDGKLSELLIDNAIQANLAKHNILPIHHELLTDAWRAKAKLEGLEAKIGDQSIEDYAATFVTTDAGKTYTGAPVNGGIGATGSKATGAGQMPETWSLTKYAEMKNESPELASAYAQKHGKSFS